MRVGHMEYGAFGLGNRGTDRDSDGEEGRRMEIEEKDRSGKES